MSKGEATRRPCLLDQGPAKRIIIQWIVRHDRSQRALAHAAGVDHTHLSKFIAGKGSLGVDVARKLDHVFQKDPSYSTEERRAFLESAGIAVLEVVAPRDSLHTSGLIIRIPGSAGPQEQGTYWMNMANSVVARSWEEAIPLYRKAENAFGRSLSQAAYAGCMVAQVLVNMGDYGAATNETIRLQQKYVAIMDPATKVQLFRVRGWLDYYQGNYPRAIRWLRQCVGVAREFGDPWIAESAQHFLGRTFTDWGRVAPGKQQADLWAKASTEFEVSRNLHTKGGTYDQKGHDLLRQAQLLRVQATDAKTGEAYRNNAREACDLRNEARGEFGEDRAAAAHVDLEEARVELLEANVAASTRKAKAALQTFAECKYPKGIADGLQLLGAAKSLDLELCNTLEYYIAALCIYPFEKNPENSDLWASIRNIYLDLKAGRGKESYHGVLVRIRDKAEERRGPFSYLDNIAVDRNAYVARIFERLAHLSLSEQ